MAHRVAYHYEAGEIPEGMVVDHLCRNRLCCNPRHLEPVTNAENLRRGAVYRSEHPEARLSYLTAACRNDHPYVEGSYRTRKGGYRVCLECNRERQRRYEDRKRSA